MANHHWRRVMMRSLFAALITLVFASVTFSQSLPDQIDRLVEQCVVDHDFMGSVLVADESEIIFAKGYGLANAEENTPNTVDTKFMIGSITKQFTAMLVTQLAERGLLKFDNTISDFLPDFPKDIGERITVEMLLDHTSGLPFPEGIEKYYYASRKQDYLQEFLKQLSEEGLRFEPGEGYGYSNAGYFRRSAHGADSTAARYVQYRLRPQRIGAQQQSRVIREAAGQIRHVERRVFL
jgi:CubicO group peptidase (beta-lactamase class C family)